MIEKQKREAEVEKRDRASLYIKRGLEAVTYQAWETLNLY